jgi:hypothetical protein
MFDLLNSPHQIELIRFKLEVSVSTDKSDMAQNSGPCDDHFRMYGLVRQWHSSIRVPDDTVFKNTEQSFDSESGFL